PIIAARPFKRSAYSLNPNFGSSSLGVTVGCGSAMIGFILMVVIEYVTNQGVLAWLGLK
ncbi:MAG: hypothetical protein F6K62_12655, partial [Sphaerospermopsis sp. SIO1G2]|nr:hypothetical protein [Sphaerospermopsis sp. SIO1G2]